MASTRTPTVWSDVDYLAQVSRLKQVENLQEMSKRILLGSVHPARRRNNFQIKV
eukprot:m.352418 g.352418  ORF g.352418 m.352418 type:complete len:54 (+) comp16583_c0_seq7:2072-2233(+)